MYCVKCGVKLADTERKCPLCHTVVYHPELTQPAAEPLYPGNRMPKAGSGKKAIGGLLLFLYLFPLITGFFSDMQPDGKLDWFGYMAGGLIVCYVIFALPIWFRNPIPIVFVPCDFVAVALYLLYIEFATGGNWFWSFALPITVVLMLIVCAVVALACYVRRGKLYVFGGATIALGTLVLMVELLLDKTFQVDFIGWSVYPLIVLSLLGGALIYLAINSSAREMVERKLFF